MGNFSRTIIFLASGFYKENVSVSAPVRHKTVSSMFVNQEVYETSECMYMKTNRCKDMK
jgi:hypothetical protein